MQDGDNRPDDECDVKTEVRGLGHREVSRNSSLRLVILRCLAHRRWMSPSPLRSRLMQLHQPAFVYTLALRWAAEGTKRFAVLD